MRFDISCKLSWVSMHCLLHWSRQQQHLLQQLQALGAQEMQWAQALDKGPWLQMYTVPGNCMPLERQTTEGSLCRTWQAGGGSFLLLPRRHALSELSTTTCVKTAWMKFKELLPVLPSHYLFFKTSDACTALVCRVQCSMPLRLGHWQSKTSNVCSKMTWQCSDRSAMSNRKTLSLPGPVSYLRSLALRIWTSFWRREGSAGMDMVSAPVMQSRQPLTYSLMESMGLAGPRWHGSSWQRGIAAESGNRHTWRSGVRSAINAASQLPGRGPTDVDVVPVPAH